MKSHPNKSVVTGDMRKKDRPAQKPQVITAKKWIKPKGKKEQ